MTQTNQVLDLLENTKFNTENDLAVLQAGLDLLFGHGKKIWEKGNKERTVFLELLAGKTALSREAWQKSQDLAPLVSVMQGCLLIAFSVFNGIGRSPLAIQKTADGYKVKLLNKLRSVSLTPGLFDAETEKLLREFKHSFFGSAAELTFGKNDLFIIKEALKETAGRLKGEKAFMERTAENPLRIFDQNASTEHLASGLFVVISALPAETMNVLLMEIGSYLPGELEEKTEDQLSVNVRSYLCASTQDLPDLFKKTRLLLKLYSGKQKNIVSLIVREKVRDFFQKLLKTDSVKQQITDHLLATAREQLDLRIKIFEGLIKLL